MQLSENQEDLIITKKVKVIKKEFTTENDPKEIEKLNRQKQKQQDESVQDMGSGAIAKVWSSITKGSFTKGS